MRMRVFYRCLAFILSWVLFSGGVGQTSAQAEAVFNPSNIVFREVMSGFTQPIFIANAGDGSNRLFIVERGGLIKVIKNGALLPTPFLDIRSLVNATGSEQGLLTLAFHPNYETNGQLYTVHTDGSGSLVLSRFTRSAGNPDVANRDSRVPLLTIPHPTYQNHNGGTLAFGRDGYLYWSTGDGGSGGDPFNNAQNLNSLLGKILRLDVDHADPGLNYAIPASNPFRNMANRRGEIWAYGLRNPWRFSFDRQTGDLFIGDVGQGAREEIDVQPAASAGGENYGWRIMEGTLCYDPSTGCDQSGKVLPVAEYSHTPGCSVTGGYIYRGAFYPDMRGQYFYADYCSGILFSLYKNPTTGWAAAQVVDTDYRITSFGEDEQGELYFTEYTTGKIYQMCYGSTVNFTVAIGGTARGNFSSCERQVLPTSFADVNSGPVKISNTDALPSIAAEQVIYKGNGVSASFSEMIGLPNSQLDNVYYLPWYNNVDLDTQLRIANVSGANATVHVSIGGAEMTGSPFTLAAGASIRKSFTGINNGPVKIESNQMIVAAERVLYKASGGINTSFSEMMALPEKQLDTVYWLPWYNNKELDTQLRIANVNNSPATVHVSIGGVEMAGSPFILPADKSWRISFAGVNSGPVKIESDLPVVAAERLIYKAAGGVNTSFSETMALPANQLSTTYWLPWHNNVGRDTQLRVANVSASPATIHVYIGGTEIAGSPFTVAVGSSIRRSFAGVNNGPMQIVSNVNIVAAQRVIYQVNNVNTSFSELMGLPDAQLDTIYWLPWYNNLELETHLEFGAP